MGGASRTQVGVLPMLATPGPVPEGAGWAFEFTWDGVRSLAEVDADRVRLIGGKAGDVANYPELDVLPGLINRRALLDGKLVALDACGRPSMSRLQHRIRLRRPTATALHRVPVAFYVFDVLRIDDHPTLHLPYRRRRELLEELELSEWPLVLPPSFVDTDGHAVLDTAVQYGLHGVIAKRVDSTYQPGRRSRNWVQTMLRRQQEVVIGGWAPARDGPADLPGCLLVGVPTDAGLHYVGSVRTGLTADVRHELRHRLADRQRRSSPFAERIPAQAARDARWVVPDLTCEVSYRRWTVHGRLSYASWVGLRGTGHPAAIHAAMDQSALPTRAHATARVAGGGTVSWEETDEEELELALRRAQAEADALRVQVSPHFVFNALATIAMLIKTDPPRARDLLMNFAGFTRYTFRTATGTTTLGDELESVEHYVELERARLESRLRVTITTSPQALPVALPFLALQTVVQSAVRHGIEERPDGGALTISATGTETDWVITVAADGPAAWARTGLDDVDDRMRVMFGDEYGLVVDAPEDGPASVGLRVPREVASPAR